MLASNDVWLSYWYVHTFISTIGQAYRNCKNSELWDSFINISGCHSAKLSELQEHVIELNHSLVANEVFNITGYLTMVQNVSKETTNFIYKSLQQGAILPNDFSVTNNILDIIIWLVVTYLHQNCIPPVYYLSYA